MKKLCAGVVLLASVLLGAACGSDDGAGCQESCEGSDDCVDGYVCMGVGTVESRQCVPAACQQCAGQQCQISVPEGGQCSFLSCVP